MRLQCCGPPLVWQRAISDSGLSLSADRCADQGTQRLAGETLVRVRSLIKQVHPDLVEEWKRRGIPGVVARRGPDPDLAQTEVFAETRGQEKLTAHVTAP